MTLGTGEHSRRWWAGIIGAIGFFAVGLAFMPGLLSSRPAPTPVFDEADTAQPHSALRAAPAALDTPSREALKASGPIAVVTGSTHAFDCMIAPNEMIDIGSSITGVIESISVERSSYVEAGQVLARLESRVEEAAVLVAKARAERTVELESTRANLVLGRSRRTRARDLYEGNTLSLDVREEVETEAVLAALGVKEAEENHRLAKLQLQQAEAALDRRTIRSPISGVVVERLMAAGEVVDEETILRIAQIDPLRVDVILPTHLFGAVSPGDEVEIIPEPPLNQARVAEVTIVDQVIDGASGTFGVMLLLPNPDRGLPGGLRCQARLSTEIRKAEADSPDEAMPAAPAAPADATPDL